MKRIWFVLVPTLVLGLLVAAGFWAGTYVNARRVVNVIEPFERGETLAGVLQATPLSDRQRQEIIRAYSDPKVVPADVSWAVPNQLTPFVGTAPKPGLHQNAPINSWQMRSPHELKIPKDEGVYRIFLTGGSTAFGSGAPTQEATIGALLERRLNDPAIGGVKGTKFEVFTFANPAWSSTQERIAIENYLSELEPNLIVSLSGNNDVFWADAGRNVLWFSTFSDDYFTAMVNVAYAVAGRPQVTALPHAGAISGKVSSDVVANRIEKNAVLGSTALAHGGTGAKWLFFLQPNLAATKKALSGREAEFLTASRAYYVECYGKISQVLRGLKLGNFAFVDLSGLFDSRSSSDEIFLDQFHFGDIGNEAIASAMTQEILQRLR